MKNPYAVTLKMSLLQSAQWKNFAPATTTMTMTDNPCDHLRCKSFSDLRPADQPSGPVAIRRRSREESVPFSFLSYLGLRMPPCRQPNVVYRKTLLLEVPRYFTWSLVLIMHTAAAAGERSNLSRERKDAVQHSAGDERHLRILFSSEFTRSFYRKLVLPVPTCSAS